MKPTHSSSANKLINKKLSINSTNTPKYVQSKIYISTKQVHDATNHSSMKKVIDTKLDLIKQEISREINEHYSRKLSKQGTKRNDVPVQNRSRKSSKSRAKSQRNHALSSSNSTSHIPPFSKIYQKYPISSSNQYDSVQASNLQPRRLFSPSDQQKYLQSSTRILGTSTSKLNLPSNQQDYKEKFLMINEKYLNEKAKAMEFQGGLMRLKSSVENFVLRPEESSLIDLLREMREARGTRSQMGHYQNDEINYGTEFMQHQHQAILKVEQGLRYLLTCYQDIQQFKQQLQHLLSITSTSSLEQLKDLITFKFAHQKPLPQSMDEFTYRFLELQSANHKMKAEYERMIEDIREKTQLEAYNVKRSYDREVDRLNKNVNRLENEVADKGQKYDRLLGEMRNMVRKYAEEIQNMKREWESSYGSPKQNRQQKPNTQLQGQVSNQVDDNNRRFYQKMKKLSQFNLYNQNQQQQSSPSRFNPYQNEFTPKYSFKPNQSNSLQSNNIKSLPQQSNEPSIEYHFSSFPQELRSMNEIVAFLVSKIGEIRYEARENVEKLRQANEAISVMDERIYEIKYELEEQVKEHQEKAIERGQVIERLQQEIKQLKQKEIKQDNQMKENLQTIKLKELESKKLSQQIEQLKQQIFENNKKTIQLFSDSCEIDQQKKAILELIRQEIYSFMRRVQKIDQPKDHHQSISDYSQHLPRQHFPILPELPSMLHKSFTQLSSLIQSKLTKHQQYHRQFIQKQKQTFELSEKIKFYQKNILSLEQTLNQTILEKEEYEYLLTEVRHEYELFKKEKEEELKHLEKKKDHELISANRTILEQNSKLNSELIEVKEQNTRLNRQLEQRVNERTFYRRKASQNDVVISEKDSKIIELQKECNKYKMYLQEIQKSFEDLVKNQQVSSMKIISLQQQKTSIKDQIQRLQTLNKALEKQNNQLRESSNTLSMEFSSLNKKIKEYQQMKASYEQMNIELRMKNIELEEHLNQQREEMLKVRYQLEKEKKTVDKLQRGNNDLLMRENEFVERLNQNSLVEKELRKNYEELKIFEDQLRLDIADKEETINLLKKEIQKFEKFQIQLQNQNKQQEQQQRIFLAKQRTKLQKLHKQLEEKQLLIGQKQSELMETQVAFKQKERQLELKLQAINQKQILIDQLKNSAQQKLHYLELRIKTAQTQEFIRKEQLNQKMKECQDQVERLNQAQIESEQKRDQLNRREIQLNEKALQLEVQNQEKLQTIKQKLHQIELQLNKLMNRQQILEQKQRLFEEKNIKQLQKEEELRGLRQKMKEKESQIHIVASENSQIVTYDQFLTPSDSISNSVSASLQQEQISQPIEQDHSKSKQKDQSLHSQSKNQSQSRSREHSQQESHHHSSSYYPDQSQQPAIILPTTHNHNQQIILIKDENISNIIQPAINQLSSHQKRHSRSLSDNFNNMFTPRSQQISINQDPIIQEDPSPMNLAQLYSQNKLPCLISQQEIDKSAEKWIQEINLILSTLLNQTQSQISISSLSYFQEIKQNYTKILSKLLRTVTPLTLDLSEIDFKNSLSSPMSFSGHKFFGLRFNSQVDTQEKEKEESKELKQKEESYKLERSKTDHQISVHDLSMANDKVKIQHLSELKLMLFNRLEEKETQNQALRQKIKQLQSKPGVSDYVQQLESKLYTFESFQNLQNDEMKVGVLWNLFKQIITSYNQDDLERFERIVRILFKMLRYPQKEIEEFNIQCENRKKQKKLPSFFTRLARGLSQEKKESKNSISPAKK